MERAQAKAIAEAIQQRGEDCATRTDIAAFVKLWQRKRIYFKHKDGFRVPSLRPLT